MTALADRGTFLASSQIMLAEKLFRLCGKIQKSQEVDTFYTSSLSENDLELIKAMLCNLQELLDRRIFHNKIENFSGALKQIDSHNITSVYQSKVSVDLLKSLVSDISALTSGVLPNINSLQSNLKVFIADHNPLTYS